MNVSNKKIFYITKFKTELPTQTFEIVSKITILEQIK